MEYHKIEGLFKRDEQTKKLTSEYRNQTVEFLKDNQWEFTEKVDGTNIRIIWDGHKVMLAGRTDKAQIPTPLETRLIELFGGDVNEQIFEQNFGEKEVILFGEGYGGKIQSGGRYKPTEDFILFDVNIGGNYQSRETVEEVAKMFNLDVVPILLTGTIEEGIEYVKTNRQSKISDTAEIEGVVGRTKVELQDRCGNRVIVKIKYSDFKE
jgi:hypothetical protein